MANLFKSLKPTADLGHSVFDLSQKHVFSSKPGMADAVCPIETVPDDHFNINMASLHRTMTMNTAAFVRGKFRYDTFFVPYSQTWHPFNQFVDQRKDVHSALQKGFASVPVFNLADLLQFALNSFRKFHWNQSNVTTVDCDMYGSPFIFGLVRHLDMLGYGNYSPILIPTEAINPNTGNAWAGTERDDAFTAAINYATQFADKFCNLFRVAAYNHIWYDYYRNKYYDEEFKPVGASTGIDYVNLFNFDDVNCTSFSTSILTIPDVDFTADDSYFTEFNSLRIYGIFMPKYVQWKKDVFTSALPGTQFGSVSTVDLVSVSDRDYGTWRMSSGNSLVAGHDIVTGSQNSLRDPTSNANIYHTHEFTSSFDVLALKRSEALQAWKQNTLRAGNMVDSNFRAHFGVEPHYEGDNNVMYLGSHEAILDVNSVTAQSSTGASVNGSVGDLAATGVASLRGDSINFDCKDFGVILTISSFVPESEYNNTMIDKANRLFEQFDFFTPEYQNIGLESVVGADVDINIFSNEANKVIGYAPRYFMYKSSVDKCHGEFANVTYLKANSFPSSISGTLRAWVTPRSEFLVYGSSDSSGYLTKSRALPTFYCSPFVLDNIFGINNRNNLNDLGRQRTDSFLNNVYFDIKAVRPMSVLGLPQF